MSAVFPFPTRMGSAARTIRSDPRPRNSSKPVLPTNPVLASWTSEMSSTRSQSFAFATERTPTSSLPSVTGMPDTESCFQLALALEAERSYSLPAEVRAYTSHDACPPLLSTQAERL